jgi:hypothetical protein
MRVEQFLAADEHNTRVSPELMRMLHPWAFDAFEDCADVFRLLYDAVGRWDVEQAEDRKLSEIAKRNDLSEDQLIQLLKTEQAGTIAGATESWNRLWALRAVKYLVMACQRFWTWGAAEHFRMRPTAALGYLRLEAEALGLIALFLKDSSLGYRWLHPMTTADGKKFFHDTQPAVKKEMATFDVAKVYDMASSSAQHVRMAGLIRSLAEEGGAVSLPDQEFNPEDPYSFHLALAHFHRIQVRILLALGKILPEMPSEWAAAADTLQTKSDELWLALQKKYGSEIAAQSES